MSGTPGHKLFGVSMSSHELPPELAEFARAWESHWSQFAVLPDGWPAEAWDESAFRAQALRLFELQYRYNEPYRRWCDSRGVRPGGPDDWRDLPAVPTPAFAELDFTCLAPGARMLTFCSSGTTRGRPSRHIHGRATLAVYETSLWWAFERAMLPDRPSPETLELLVLMPSPAEAPYSSLVHMCDTVRRRLQRGSEVFVGRVDSVGRWVLDVEAAWSRLERWAAAGRPVLILATAFLLVHLLDAMEEGAARVVLAPGSRLMETGGYKGRSREVSPEELRDTLEDRLGLTSAAVVSEYGMCELSSQAYDGVWRAGAGGAGSADPWAPGLTVVAPVRVRRRFRFPPWVRFRVVDPDTGSEVPEGGVGLLRVYDLANVGSVLAVQTEDLVERVRDGFRLRGRAAGAEPRGCSLWAEDRPMTAGRESVGP